MGVHDKDKTRLKIAEFKENDSVVLAVDNRHISLKFTADYRLEKLEKSNDTAGFYKGSYGFPMCCFLACGSNLHFRSCI